MVEVPEVAANDFDPVQCAITRELVAQISEQVTTIYTTICGNGKPGMDEVQRQHERRIATIEANRLTTTDRVWQIVRGVILIAAGAAIGLISQAM